MRNGLRLAAWLALLVAIPLWAPPHAAFTAAIEPRGATAQIVADALAYVALSWPACSVPTQGGSCELTITNKATVPLRYTATLISDSPDTVDTYSFPLQAAVASGAMSTSGDIAVGASVALTVNVLSCDCGGAARTPTWDIEALQLRDMRAIAYGFPTPVGYGGV